MQVYRQEFWGFTPIGLRPGGNIEIPELWVRELQDEETFICF